MSRHKKHSGGPHRHQAHQSKLVYTYSWEDREYRRMKRNQRSYNQIFEDQNEYNELPKLDMYFTVLALVFFAVLMILYFTTIIPLLV